MSTEESFPDDMPEGFPGDITPEDIFLSEQTHEVLRAEIDAELADVDSGTEAAVAAMTKSYEQIRQTNFGLLGRLDDMGIEDAQPLKSGLIVLGENEDPLMADLSRLASALDEERYASPDPDTQLYLKRLSSLAYALSAISIAMSVKALEPDNSTSGRALIRFAGEAVESAEVDAETKKALGKLIRDLESTIEPEPEQ